MPSIFLTENTDRLSDNHCVNFLDGLSFVSIIGAASKLSAEGVGALGEFGQPAILALNTVPLVELNPGSRVIDFAAIVRFSTRRNDVISIYSLRSIKC